MSLSWVEAGRLAAKGGPADRLRRGLIALCAGLAAMILAAAATIPSQHGGDVANGSVLGWLLTDASMAPGLMTALGVLSLPVIHLAVQAVRVGAPARDRRLEALRAAGATLADVRRVVRAEVVAMCTLGAALGVIGFYVFMWAAPHVLRVSYTDHGEDIGAHGADVVTGTVPVIGLSFWPHPLIIAGAAALVPFAAAVLVPLVVRRAPSRGLARSHGRRGMSPWLASAYFATTAVAGGSVLVMIFAPVDGNSRPGGLVNLLFIPMLLGTFGLLLCTLVVFASSTASLLGRVLVHRGGAVGVLAGRMMQARPGLASRTAVSMVLVGFTGGLAIVLRGVLENELQAMSLDNGFAMRSPEGPSTDLLFYTVPVMAAETLALVAGVLGAIGLLVAVAEQVALRRPDLARQVAAGVPSEVIRRALVVEAALPVALVTSLALIIGAAIPVLSVSLTGNAVLLDRVAWPRLAGFWLTLVGGAVLATWLGGHAVRSSADPRRIRDRE